MFSVLFLFGLVSTALSFPGPAGVTEGLPDLAVEAYFDSVAATVFRTLNQASEIKGWNWEIEKIFGIPINFKIQTSDGVLESPTELKRITKVSGIQEMSGTAHIQGYLYMGTLEVRYETITVSIFGHEISGKATAKLNEVTTPVNIHIYNNAVQTHKASATIGELNGYITVHLGSDSGFVKVVNYILDAAFFIRYAHDAFRWAFFQSIVPIIEDALSNAANIQTM